MFLFTIILNLMDLDIYYPLLIISIEYGQGVGLELGVCQVNACGLWAMERARKDKIDEVCEV